MKRTTPYAHPSDHVDPTMTDAQRRKLWALAVDSLSFCEASLMPCGISMDPVEAHRWSLGRGGLLLTKPRTNLEEHCNELRRLLEDITMGEEQ